MSDDAKSSCATVEIVETVRPPKQTLIGRKLPNVRPDLVGTDPGHPAMIMRGPEASTNRLGLGLPSAPRGGLFRGLTPPEPEEPAHGEARQEGTYPLEGV